MKRFLLPAMIAVGAALHVHAQNEAVYYSGLNPVAPFTAIRSNFAGGTLPAAANLESGISLFIGKIWNRNYNVETRVSYGSPAPHMRQFLVQGGMMYCFNRKRQVSLLNSFYAGMFLKLEEMSNKTDDSEQSAAIVYWTAGKRFSFGRLFADVRINQHILGIKWGPDKAAKATMGFHSSIYNWGSAYVPFAGVGFGYRLGR